MKAMDNDPMLSMSRHYGQVFRGDSIEVVQDVKPKGSGGTVFHILNGIHVFPCCDTYLRNLQAKGTVRAIKRLTECILDCGDAAPLSIEQRGSIHRIVAKNS